MNARTGDRHRGENSNLSAMSSEEIDRLVCKDEIDSLNNKTENYFAIDRFYLIRKAGVVLEERKRRSSILSKSIFGEPAWDILLHLYTARDMALTVRQLVFLVNEPKTTLLRWIAYLEEKRLVSRRADDHDRRLSWIYLDRAQGMLDKYFADSPDFTSRE